MALRRTATMILSLTFLLTPGCGRQEEAVDPARNLCRGDAGVGMRVFGRAEPVDICVTNDRVSVAFTDQSHYDVAATVDVGGTVFKIQMVFAHHEELPATLHLTGNPAELGTDPFAAWLYYQEIPESGDPVESAAITSGNIKLGFSDGTVTAGTISGVVLEIQNQISEEPAGTRAISEGFFSLSVKQ